MKPRKSLGVKMAIPRNGFSTTGIATIVNLFCYANQLGFLQEGDQETHSLLFGQVFVESIAGKDFGQFKQDWGRDYDLSIVNRLIKGLARNRIRE